MPFAVVHGRFGGDEQGTFSSIEGVVELAFGQVDRFVIKLALHVDGEKEAVFLHRVKREFEL